VEQRSGIQDKLSWARSIFILDPLIYLYTVVFATLSLLSSFVDGRGTMQHWFARTWSRLILATSMSPVEIIGMDRLASGRPYLYAVNHLSAFDIPTLYANIPGQFRIIAKKELFAYPFLGWHLRRSGQLPIDQQNPGSSVRSVKRAIDTLKSGMPLVIFPEGGRSASGQVQPFMTGAFYIALKAQVEIVPLVIVGTYEVLPMNTFHIRPGKIKLVAGEPIPTKDFGLREMDVLTDRVKRAVEDIYYAHASVPDPRPAPTAAE
jgi:1-acyl-sn-glycerol-3-phosphate acyltransferase